MHNNIVDCTTNSNWIIAKLMADVPTYEESKKCKKCEMKFKKLFVIDVNETEIINQDFKQNFLNFISKFFSIETVICKTCKSKVQITKTTQPCLFFDTEIFFQKNKTKYAHGITLSDNLEKINVQKQIYVLNGIVGYIPGYFTSFCRSATGIWTEHDDMSRKLHYIKNLCSIQIHPITIIFVRI